MKSMKKLVLAGLVLLASVVGLLSLAGCKNDSVPEPTRYTVSFDKGDNSEYTGDLPADITVESGTKLTAEQLKGLVDTADYIFEGWYDGETKAKGGTYTVAKDVTLEAKWKPRDQVQISFKVSGNTVELSSEPAGATIHYTTDGTEPKESWDEYANPIEISSKTTIKAYAEKLGELKESDVGEKTYLVVTFKANGKDTKTETVESGQTATRPEPDPTKDGWTFLGWYEDSGLTKEFDFSTLVTADTTLYAKWRANPGTVVKDALTINNVTLEKTSEVQVLSEAVNLSSLHVKDSEGNSVSQIFVENRVGSIQPFVMGQYEVTQQLYFAVMGNNPSDFKTGRENEEPKEGELPVEQVSWYDAVVFCNELTKKVLGPGACVYYSDAEFTAVYTKDAGATEETPYMDTSKSGYRLPTEAEWELAARGGNPKANAWQYTYAGSYASGGVAWYHNNSGNDVGQEKKTHQVGTKADNGLKLYDMSGNVWEWCWDRWDDGSIDAGTPSGGADSGSYRVNRGGSWDDYANFCSVSFRYGGNLPSGRYYVLGFRLVRSAN